MNSNTTENRCSKNTYLDLCTKVYDISKPEPPSDAYKFYKSYADEINGSILEPMCGSGRFLIPLLATGLNIEGFDASDHMLHALREKAELKHLSPKVEKNFIETFDMHRCYDLIFIPAGSFGLILDNNKIKEVIKNLYIHLNKNGILLFEVETENSLPPLEIWKGSRWEISQSQSILLSTCTSLNGNIYTMVCKYELIENNTIIQTEVEELKVRLYKIGELDSLLKKSGFRNIRMLKPYNRHVSPDIISSSFIYECHR